MARFAELDDDTVDDLLRGNTPEGYEDLAPVAALAVAVRARATAHGPEISPALRAQLLERPHVPPRYVGVARRRLRLGAAAAAAVAVVGVAAAQNALPASAQRFVSSAADLVGIHVPHPDDDDGAPSVTTVDGPESTSDDGEGPGDGGTTPGDEGTTGSGDARRHARRTAPPGQSSTGGPPDETPGGATPADPGTPGDHEPATPAIPPPNSNGGGNGNNGGGNGQGNGNGQGQGQRPGPGPGQRARPVTPPKVSARATARPSTRAERGGGRRVRPDAAS